MKIGLGATVWARGAQTGHLDGIGHYTQELARSLVNKTDGCLPVVFGKSGAANVGGLEAVRLKRYSTSAVASAVTGCEFAGASELCNRVDLFHATDHYTPKFKNLPVVATLMDAIPLSHPEWVNKRLRKLKNWLWRTSGQWADHVITISEFSKKEIATHFRIPEQRISVTPLGVDGRYFQRISPELAQESTATLNLPERFFMFVGTFQPRKNIERIIDAHESLPEAMRKAVPLLVVGRSGWGCDELVARLQAYGSGGYVRWLENVNDSAKRVMMQRATALVFPSLLEGFGLPVLEGFASQTPVITSNTSSLPEVAGDAAWTVDPYDVKAMTEAMMTLGRDESVGRELVAKGLARAHTFTWDACAEKTVQVYNEVLSKA